MVKNKTLILSLLIILLTSGSSKLQETSMQEVVDFVKSQVLPKVELREIKVFTGRNWNYTYIPSVSNYLFEEIEMNENIAPEDNYNRPGTKFDKHYVCVHDTGDHNYGAQEWSNIVYTNKIGDRDYNVSYQYVVGNDGYYHNIPDDETAYHAGDGGQAPKSLFEVYASGVYTDIYTTEKPKIEISEDGFYLINGQKSSLEAPRDGDDQIVTTADINDLGIYSELQKVDNEEKYQYYLGKTWYSTTYKKISNRGGNLNSIGIESCVNHDTDVYYTWQRVAKLVAKLMDEHNFGIDAVVQHHYFSGKNCPQTMRTAKLWEFYKTMISAEYQILKYKKEGYI